MSETGYEPFEALDPFFEVVMEAYEESLTANTILIPLPKTRPLSPGISSPVGLCPFRGRANLMAALSGYGKTSGFTPVMRLSCIALRIAAS